MSLPALRARLAALNGRGRAVIALLSGLVSVVAQAPLFWWPVLLVILPILIWLLEGSSRTRRPVRSAAFLGWWFGFGHFLTGLYWIGEAFLVDVDNFLWLLPFAVTLLPAGLALLFGLVFALTLRFSMPGFGRIALFAILWTAGEWLRGHILTGFPWNLAAYIWGGQETMMQLASLIGSYSLGLISIFALASPAVLGWAGPKTGLARTTLGLAVGLLATQFLYGTARLQAAGDDLWVPDVKLRLVQPSIAQKIKWDPAYREEIFSTMTGLTRSGGSDASNAGITHVIWPESASPFLLARSPDALAAIDQALGDKAYLITGQQRAVPRAENKYDFYNSVMLVTPGGTITNLYDKVHLVPFGEYLPFRSLLTKIGLRQLVEIRGAGFTPGNAYQVTSAPNIPEFVPLICYEILFPGRVPRAAGRSPDWILNVTNDAWFGSSFGPYQHLTASRFRAVEEGLPVIRAANTGISAVIDGYGRISAQLDINERGIIDTRLPVRLDQTVYPSIRDAGVLVMALVFWLISRLTSIVTERNDKPAK